MTLADINNGYEVIGTITVTTLIMVIRMMVVVAVLD